MPTNQTWLSGLQADGFQITATDSSVCCLSTSKTCWSLQGLRSWNKLHQRVFLNSPEIYQSKPASLTVQTITPCHRESEANSAALYRSGPLTSLYLANIFVFPLLVQLLLRYLSGSILGKLRWGEASLSGNTVKDGWVDVGGGETWLIRLAFTFIYKKTLFTDLFRCSRKHLLSAQTQNKADYTKQGEDAEFTCATWKHCVL